MWLRLRCIEGQLPAGHVGMILSGRSGVGKTIVLQRAAKLAGVDMETFHPWSSFSSGSFEHMVASAASTVHARPRMLVVDQAEGWAGYGRDDDSADSRSTRSINTFDRWVKLAKKGRVKNCTIVFTCADLSSSKLQKMVKSKTNAWRHVDVEKETGRKGVNLSVTSANIFEGCRSVLHLVPRAPAIMDTVAMAESDSRLAMVMWWNGPYAKVDPTLWSYMDATTPYSPWNAAHVLAHVKRKRGSSTARVSVPQIEMPATKYWNTRPKALSVAMDAVHFKDIKEPRLVVGNAEQARDSLIEWWNQEED